MSSKYQKKSTRPRRRVYGQVRESGKIGNTGVDAVPLSKSQGRRFQHQTSGRSAGASPMGRSLNTPEPPPSHGTRSTGKSSGGSTSGDSSPRKRHTTSIQERVRQDLVEREGQGIKKYGTALMPFNGRSALRDAYQEALDL